MTMGPDSSARRISSWDFWESTAVVGAGLPLAASLRWHIEQCSLNRPAPSAPALAACAEAPTANAVGAASSPSRIAVARAILILSPMNSPSPRSLEFLPRRSCRGIAGSGELFPATIAGTALPIRKVASRRAESGYNGFRSKAQSGLPNSIFLPLHKARGIHMLNIHVVRRQAVYPAPGRIPCSEGLSGSQLGRCGPHREVQLWRGASQGAPGQLPHDHHSFEHASGPVHAALGRGLPEILADQRRPESSHPCGPTR